MSTMKENTKMINFYEIRIFFLFLNGLLFTHGALQWDWEMERASPIYVDIVMEVWIIILTT